jgi:NAD(P)-dependent dehydrogenase (short-subunit alcohol dehydrogenase family)
LQNISVAQLILPFTSLATSHRFKSISYRNEQEMTRIAVITGASSGIGRASAVALARTGQWSIVLSGRRQAELEKTAELCKEACGEKADDKLTLIVAGDVSSEDNVKQLFERTKEVYGRADMLFNVSVS